MRAACVRILWCCAAWLSTCATAAEPIAGPWVLLTPDGGARIGCEWDAPPTGVATLAIEGVPTLGTPGQRPLERRPGERSVVVDVAIDRLGYRPGRFVLSVGGRHLEGRLPRLPATDAAVRVALAGGVNWPEARRLESLAATLGGAPEVVVAAGPGLLRELGRGGWEHTTPVLLLGTVEDGLSALAPEANWPRGRAWGALGLASAESEDAWSPALAGLLCPWRVMVDGGPGWDPGVLAPRAQAQPHVARDRIALAAGLRVPLILACAGRAGFISEPLVLRERTPRVGAPGPRVVGATPAGEALALDDHIATAIPGPGLVGLAADGERLRLVVSADGGPPLTIEWTLSGGPGCGAASPTVAWQEWRAEQSVALADLAWAAGSELTAVTVANEQRTALITAAAEDGIARLALRRLLSLPSAPAGPIAEQPAWLARDIALRDLGRGHLAAGSTAALALVAGEDEWIVAVAIRAAQGPHRARLLDLLAERLRAQAAGRLPFAADPLLQHRLVAAVFDAADLGPTPLRPLAVALRPRLDPLARGPVERFLARHGEVRPAKR